MADARPTDDKCASDGNSFERVESLDPFESSAARERFTKEARFTMEEGDGESLVFAFLSFLSFSS